MDGLTTSPLALFAWTEPGCKSVRMFGPGGRFPTNAEIAALQTVVMTSAELSGAFERLLLAPAAERVGYLIVAVGSTLPVVAAVYSRFDDHPEAARSRSALLAEADAAARTIGCRGIEEQIEALRDNVHRKAATSTRGTVWISFASGAAEVANRTIRPTMKEWELLALLVLARRSVPAETLACELWPDADEPHARKCLNVVVHRLRKKLGDPGTLHFAHNMWRLGSDVRVDLIEWEEFVTSMTGSALSSADRARLEHLNAQLVGGPPGTLYDSPHFDRVDLAIKELRERVVVLLVNDALSTGRAERAIALAREMLQADAAAEHWHDVLIRVHLDAGNRLAAQAQFREYRRALANELGVAPSPEIRRLLERETQPIMRGASKSA